MGDVQNISTSGVEYKLAVLTVPQLLLALGFHFRQFEPLKPTSCVYYLLLQTKTLHSTNTVYPCVPYGSKNKQRLYPQTALTGWAL
jgi:hypothetical protein